MKNNPDDHRYRMHIISISADGGMNVRSIVRCAQLIQKKVTTFNIEYSICEIKLKTFCL